MSIGENSERSYGEMLYPSSDPCCTTMEQLLRTYIHEEYDSLEVFGKTIGIAKSTFYDYFRDGIPDDVFAVICFRLRLHPLRIMELISKGTSFKLSYNGNERNSVIIRHLISCYDNSTECNLDACNAELRIRGLRLIGENV